MRTQGSADKRDVSSSVSSDAASSDEKLSLPKVPPAPTGEHEDGNSGRGSIPRAQLSNLVKEAMSNVAKAERGDILLVANRARADRVEMIAAATLMCNKFSRDVSRSFTGALERRVRATLGEHIIARTDVEVAEVAVKEALKLIDTVHRYRAGRSSSASVLDEKMVKLRELRARGHADISDR